MFQAATPRHTCIACGHQHEEAAMRPFGRRDGTVTAWACLQCLDPSTSTPERPHTPLTAAFLEVIA